MVKADYKEKTEFTNNASYLADGHLRFNCKIDKVILSLLLVILTIVIINDVTLFWITRAKSNITTLKYILLITTVWTTQIISKKKLFFSIIV